MNAAHLRARGRPYVLQLERPLSRVRYLRREEAWPTRPTASITVDAAPAEVMAVIADFEAYPQWSNAVKEVSVLETGTDGRPTQVWFRIDSGPLKDAYVLAYDWRGNDAVSWRLVDSKLLKALDGSYELPTAATGRPRSAIAW